MSGYDDSVMNGDETSTNGNEQHFNNGSDHNQQSHNDGEARRNNKIGFRPTVQPFAARLFGNDIVNEDTDANGEKKKKKKQIAKWPHDDYDEIQTRYYKVVDNAKLVEESTPSYVSRPEDMPDIPTAVQNLPLVEFERKAEDRAIGIVSTWIFDAGLIDELLLETPSHKGGGGDYDEAAGGAATGGGTQKMDTEIVKLRDQTERDLALINNRLNDGVAASGSEVQELVNAVEATKGDLLRLNELTSYISNGGDAGIQHKFLLTNYPKLKTAINGRRNLARCFRELDFFSQIPSTCDRLRDELNTCEWTDHEWTTIRNVCREHVELQIFLVEAEAGMKARIDEEEANGQQEEEYDHRGRPTRGMRKSGNSFRYAPTENNHESVDRFLNEHVKNVSEVGDEIHMRVMSGIGAAFDLSRQNPAGMVALVEAVEVYEAAAEEYRNVHGGIDPMKVEGRNSSSRRTPSNSITDMRRAALVQIAEDFQTRAIDVFNGTAEKAREEANDPYGDNRVAEFNAVLRAANSLTYQIEIVKQHMSPCFPPYWNVETLWMTCVAAVCSEHILEHIGGQEGNELNQFTVTQLLDLVAWIESFRHRVEDSFPNLLQLNRRNNKKTKLKTMQELMKGKEIDMESAKENLSWVTNVLWDAHTVAQDQFIMRTREQTLEWLQRVYENKQTESQTTEGRLITSLPEDIFALAGVQLRTIRERLTKKSSVLVDAVTIVFSTMQQIQKEKREGFLEDLEECCAAANDFMRMSDQCDDIVEELLENTDLPPQDQRTVEEVANGLTRHYTNDAVFAAQHIHGSIFEPIEQALEGKLFSDEWEEDATNESALTVVRTIEDFMTDVLEFMEKVMVGKLLNGLVRAAINFYIKQLLLKAETRGNKDSCFNNNKNARDRIAGDMKLIRGCFEGYTDDFPSLSRVINVEFEVWSNIFALIYYAADDDSDPEDMSDYFPAIQKSIKNVSVSRYMIGDLFHLLAPDKEKFVYELFDQQEDDLRAFELNDPYVDEHFVDDTLQLDKVVIGIIGESKRSRPGETRKKMEKAFANWGWNGGDNGDDDNSADDVVPEQSNAS